MFFRERCSLCGGKLDGNKICTECGLDNSKSEKNYHINQSSCDGQPLTHEHHSKYYSGSTDSQKGQKGTRQQTRDMQNRKQRTQKKNKRPETGRTYNTYIENGEKARKSGNRRIILTIIIIGIVIVFSSVIPLLEQFISEQDSGSASYSSDYYDDNYDYDYDYDPYANVTREEPTGGERYSEQFSQGDYVVGTHIPEGTYTMTGDGENYISLSVEDRENGIYLFEITDSETTSADDIRLFTGAVVTISEGGYVTLSADNAQTDKMAGQPNPLTGTVRVSEGETLTAGKDFPAGVYDITAAEGYGSPDITIYDQDGNAISTLYPRISDSSGAESTFRNAVLPEGAVFENTNKNLEIELVPSEKISSEDYLGYYIYS